MTEEEVVSGREVAAKIAAEQGVKNFLVDVRPSTLKPSYSAVYDHGDALSRFNKFISVRFSILTSEIDSTDSLLKTFATNRGVIIQVFE